MKRFLIVLSMVGLLVACQRAEDRSNKPTVRIEAPGARIVVDGDKGVVDIEANGARVYADKSGRVEIVAPGPQDDTESK